MASISNLKVGENLYNIKDPTARTTAEIKNDKKLEAITWPKLCSAVSS